MLKCMGHAAACHNKVFSCTVHYRGWPELSRMHIQQTIAERWYRIHHQLKQFPTIAGQRCTYVMLNSNQITRFPANLQGTESIWTLNLHINLISELPVDLTLIERLELFDMSRNKITPLSQQTKFPVSLRGLLLSGNYTKTMPAGIQIRLTSCLRLLRQFV